MSSLMATISNNEDNEFPSFVRPGNPSVDQNASHTFDLVGLPFVPKHLIFSYLDMESLNKVRQASHLVNNFVLTHRNRFVSYENLPNVTIYCCDVAICVRVDESGRRKCFIMKKTKSGRLSFFRGFTDRFCNTRIERMEIFHFSFGEEEMEHLAMLWEKRKVKADVVVLHNVDLDRSSPAAVTRFLKIVKPLELKIFVVTKNASGLFTEEFYDLLPSFQDLCVNGLEDFYADPRYNSIPISPTMNVLPPNLNLCSERIFPIGVLRNAFQAWWRNEAEIRKWKLNIDPVYLEPSVFERAINLPWKKIIKPAGGFPAACIIYSKNNGERPLQVTLKGVSCGKLTIFCCHVDEPLSLLLSRFILDL